MAAMTTTYFEAGRGWAGHIAEHNAALLAEQAERRRRVRTPEFFFVKHFDNSRLIKAADPVRARQMRAFSIAAMALFVLVMIYGLQHFSAIENSMDVEHKKQQITQLREENHQLRLEKAKLTDPERIDRLARQQGFSAPEPDQMVHPNAASDSNAPVLAQAAPPYPAAQ
jgi:cell division protein FtsL